MVTSDSIFDNNQCILKQTLIDIVFAKSNYFSVFFVTSHNSILSESFVISDFILYAFLVNHFSYRVFLFLPKV